MQRSQAHGSASPTESVGPGPRLVPMSLGALIALVGACHLAAWLSGVMTARGLTAITMKANAALCLLLLGSALLAAAKEDGPRWRCWTARACSSLALVIAVLTLVEHAASIDLRIDEILATELPGAVATERPNRMGMPGSSGFTLTALALLLLCSKKRRSAAWAQVLGLGVCLIGLLPLTGYLFSAEPLYGVTKVTAIAWVTALSLVGLGVGALLARPTSGILSEVTAADAGGVVIRRLLVPVLLLPFALAWLEMLALRLEIVDAAMGTALLTLLFVLTLSVLTWSTGRRASHAAAELGQQREVLKVTLQSIGDAVISCDIDGNVTFLNPVCAELTGWSIAEAVGKPIEQVFRIVNEQTGAAAENIARAVLRDGRTFALANHTALVTRQGRLLPIEDSAAPIRDGSGHVAGAVLVFHDVTEKRRAQEQLREREAFYRGFFENLSEGVAVYDAIRGDSGDVVSWRISDVNGRYAADLGCERAAVVGSLASDIFGEKTHDYAQEWLHVLSTNQARSYERIRGGRHFLISCFPMGRDRIALTGLDITERKLRENRISQLSSLYAVLSRVNEAIVRARDQQSLFEDVCRIVASDGNYPLVWIGRVNGEHVRPVAFCGPAQEYLDSIKVDVTGELGRGPTGTAIREDRAMVNEDFVTNAATSPWREAAMHHGLRSSAALPLRQGGHVIGALTLYGREAAAFDSEHVQLFEALVADISYALDAMQRAEALRESEHSLREADQRKNEFLAMLSHELRNPLAPIRNALQILERSDPGGEQAARARAMIERQTAHMKRLVEDLLDITRITRGKIQLVRERLDLAELLSRTVDDYREQFVKNGVELSFNGCDGAVWIDGDPTRIAQVVGNLLHNAVKFTPRGGRTSVMLTVDSGHVVLRIRDTGLGVEPSMQARLFAPFTQADSTLDRSRGGLGLGLSLVKALTEMHGGTVSVASDGIGKGTEFTVCLPLSTPASPTVQTVAVAPRAKQARRVLVIEDNRDAADSLRELVELLGHMVDVAYSGTDGIAKARTFRPDIVFCDIGLPELDGFGVARWMRSEPSLRQTFLVALSGYAQREDIDKCRDAGFHRHVAKPPDIDVIERILAEAPHTAS